MSDKSLFHSLFYPKSIAIIGASTRIGSVGNDVLKNVLEQKFAGSVYPVNPKADKLYGIPCYKDINDIAGEIDLAIIVVPAALVPDVLVKAGKKKVKSAIVISAGFKESGPAGQELEKQIQKIAEEFGIVLIGPNCLGLLNPEIHLNASFAQLMPAPGSIAFISQSGALCTSVLDYARGLGIGFSKFVSIGNKACTNEIDLITYLADDPQTKVIMMYEEQLSDATRFIKTVRALTTRPGGKPVISLKSGRTSVGASASASHTGALGGDDAMVEAVFRKAGVTRAYSIEELFDYAITFVNNPLPKGNRFAIITNAGGPGVITTDEAAFCGLELAKLSDKTTAELKKVLPAAANTHNPIDVLGDANAKRYSIALENVCADPNVDMVIVILTPQTMTEVEATAREIVRIKSAHNKPIVASFMGMDTVGEGVRLLQKGNVATISFPEYAARSLSVLAHFALRTRLPFSATLLPKGTDSKKASKAILTNVENKTVNMPPSDVKTVLEAYGLPFLKEQTVRTKNEAEKAASLFGNRVVLKVISPDIVHKSDVGGVVLDVEPKNIGESYDKMMATLSKKAPNAKIEGVLIVEMAPRGGLEFIVGGKRDETLDVATIMVGMGGVYVEIYKDVSFGVVPLTRYAAEMVIGRTKASKILDGVRGQPPLDKEALIDSLGRISALFEDFPQIKELDINPLVVYEKGVKVLDARIKL